MPKRVRVISTRDEQRPTRTNVVPTRTIVARDTNPAVPGLTENEKRARKADRIATTTSMGSSAMRMAAMGAYGIRTADTIDSQTASFYSPQLSTDFLEKPQNIRERRAFYRFFYNTNEIVGQAIDIHSTLPLSKLRLVPPKGKNKHQNEYVYKFFLDMCERIKLFKTLIEISHDYYLLGNCTPGDSLIRTESGYKFAKDIAIGDKVLTHKNRWRPVLKICQRETDEILNIICNDMPYPLRVTKEHPAEIITDEGTEFVVAGELKKGQFIRPLIPGEPGLDQGNEKLLAFEKQFLLDNCCGVEISDIVCEKGKIEVFNFEVEEDHTYQIAGYSTHNCFIFAEEQDWESDFEPEELARKKHESLQRAEMLREKYKVIDKNPLFKGWDKLLVLPPDQVRVRKLPLSDDVAIEYMPDPETRKFLTSDIQIDPSDPTKKTKNSISNELREKIKQSGVIPLDTDPNSGSHVYHLARKKSQYEPLGVSIIERCINTLILLDKLRQAQTSIASRHMTPMRVIWSDGLNSTDVDNLREQVDMALVDPDFSIIANYEIHWEEMGSQGRLLDLSAEDENGLNRLFAGLGVTREILTGEGTYTGSKISLEIMNTQYLLFREVIQEYVENYLFKPIARKKGFIEYDDYGNEVLLYPRLSFTRLAIRDNEQFFDAVFQLYQKGSVSIDLILDILNIDPDSTREKIEKDLFTVNDSVFNEVMRNIYTNVAAPLVEKTDLVAKLADYLKLQVTEEKASAEGASRFSSTKEAKEEKKEPSEKQIKLMKVMKYLQANPEILDRIVKSKEVLNGGTRI